MRQNYLFIPSFVFCAMKRSLTKAQFGEVISSVADSVYSNDDAPSASIIKGSDKYAFHYIMVEATKMQGTSGRSSHSKSASGLLLPMMNLLAMHDNLTNSDLAEVVFKAADYAEGMQIESFDKSSAMAAHFSMLVRSMDLQLGANKAKSVVVEKKGKSSSKTKMQKSANADTAVVSDETAVTADLPKITETATDDNFAEGPEVSFDDIFAKFGGSDSDDYLDKSRDIWSSLTVDEQRAAFVSVDTYLLNSDTKHYLYQYLSHKAWLAD